MWMVILGFFASVLAGLATGIGALPVLIFETIPDRIVKVLLGGAAGVMLAATAFSLVVPGIEHGNQLWPGKGALIVALGMMLGAGFLDLVDRFLPHEHLFAGPEGPSSPLRKVWLFIIAIAIHNFPEGLAVGVGFGGGDVSNGFTLTLGIALQNMPEGLAVALPLIALGYERWDAIKIATYTGLVEAVGGLLGISSVTIFHPVLPWGMAFAAGAMLFIISDEIIPETHSEGRYRAATFGVMVGFVIMMMLDTILG